MKLLSVMMFVLALAISNIAHAAGEIIIKFSHVVAPDTPKGRAAEKFKQLAEQMTKGRVKVEIYPNSQLYKDREEIEALQSGAVQMLAPSMAKFGPMGAREFELFDLPYPVPRPGSPAPRDGWRGRQEAVRQAGYQRRDRSGIIGTTASSR